MRLNEIILPEARRRNVDLYHCTDTARLRAIQAHGLDPNKSREPALRQRAIYLSNDPDHARAYANHDGDWQGAVLLRVNTRDLDERLLGPDDVDLPNMLDQEGRERDWRDFTWMQSLRMSGQCTYAGVIPPTAIHVLK